MRVVVAAMEASWQTPNSQAWAQLCHVALSVTMDAVWSRAAMEHWAACMLPLVLQVQALMCRFAPCDRAAATPRLRCTLPFAT